MLDALVELVFPCRRSMNVWFESQVPLSVEHIPSKLKIKIRPHDLWNWDGQLSCRHTNYFDNISFYYKRKYNVHSLV